MYNIIRKYRAWTEANTTNNYLIKYFYVTIHRYLLIILIIFNLGIEIN